MAARGRFSNLLYRPGARFALLSVPGVLFIIVFLLVPIISIVIFSFWRTEKYEIYADWNINNYAVVLGQSTYPGFSRWIASLMTFLGDFAIRINAIPSSRQVKPVSPCG